MKKILMRAPADPLASIPALDVITRNLINDNLGNLMFPYSITKTLLREDTQIDTIKAIVPTKKEIDRINREYDCFLIPLANAFRSTFLTELASLTKLVQGLKIPCVVVGVGFQSRIGDNVNDSFDFDGPSREFVKAILEKSAMVGVRGEITAAYLKKLGFREEKDFTVIGCPSMYLHGDQVPVKEPGTLTEKSKICVNKRIRLPGTMHEFLTRESRRFEDCVFVPQAMEDLLLLYAGVPISRAKFPKIHATYPARYASPELVDDRERGFVNVPSWLEFLASREFSFGTRIHGNIAAVMAGTPVLIFAMDGRVRELASYHNIPYLTPDQITEDTNILDLHEKTDFYSVQKGHKERFYHYLDFLEANGLQHIYGKERTGESTLFEERQRDTDYGGGIRPISSLDPLQQGERLESYYAWMDQKYGSVKNLERYARMEKKLLGAFDKAPGAIKPLLKKCAGKLW